MNLSWKCVADDKTEAEKNARTFRIVYFVINLKTMVEMWEIQISLSFIDHSHCFAIFFFVFSAKVSFFFLLLLRSLNFIVAGFAPRNNNDAEKYKNIFVHNFFFVVFVIHTIEQVRETESERDVMKKNLYFLGWNRPNLIIAQLQHYARCLWSLEFTLSDGIIFNIPLCVIVVWWCLERV